MRASFIIDCNDITIEYLQCINDFFAKGQKWNFLENLEIIDYITDYVTKKAHQLYYNCIITDIIIQIFVFNSYFKKNNSIISLFSKLTIS